MGLLADSCSKDGYVWNYPTFLPVFPSGNVQAEAVDKKAESPCTSKNVLCVGASYNAPRLYQTQPSFVHSTLLLGLGSCVGDLRSTCATEVDAVPALFGATKPSAETLSLCEAVVDDCLTYKAACPECAYNPARLQQAVDAPVTQAVPSEACSALSNFPRGRRSNFKKTGQTRLKWIKRDCLVLVSVFNHTCVCNYTSFNHATMSFQITLI